MSNITQTKHLPAARTQEQGFTLIELSIVLVIIGLIVGGILVGQDMIKAAEIRATIAQVEKLNSAVNTFRNKYNGKPGDLNNATNFSFTARTQNGDGIISSCTGEGGGSEASPLFGCADKFFWNDLSASNLIPESFTDTTAATGFPSSAISAAFNTYFETPKMGGSNYIVVWGSNTAGSGANNPSVAGINYVYIRGLSSISTAGAFTWTNSLSPTQAFQIDTKMDDGNPNSGSVMAVDNTTGADAITGSSSTCATATGNSGVYNTVTAYVNSALCAVRIRASF